jgi:CubicO group peptidase (beta-lactamase class C family)
MRFIFIGVLFLIACQTVIKNDLTIPPQKLDDGWNVASPLKYNANIGLLDSMIQGINNDDFTNIHSVLIVKNSVLILEKYFDGNNRYSNHEIRSATKSIGSILTGIAIDKGYIPSEESLIYEYLKDDYNPSYGWDTKSKEIRISHLLSMLSGYDCDDLNTNFACEGAMYGTDDWVQYALDLPISYDPGQHWAYNSSSLILVSNIIEKTSGQNLDAFAEKYLFDPLGIKNFQWERSPKGLEWIGGGASMIPREMAKIGLLMIQNGEWDNNSIVSKEWIVKSTSRHGEMIGSGVDYCFLWQKGETIIEDQIISAYWASGNGGQYIIIIPKFEMVVVFTGGNYDSELANQPFFMLTNYILPAFLQNESRESVNLDLDYLESLAGSYALDFEPTVNSKIDVFQDGIRILTPDNQFVVLEAVTETIFKGMSPLYGPLSVRFISNNLGEISGLITYGGFSKYIFEKN